MLVVVEPFGDFQPVPALQHLRGLDGLGHFPLAEPNGTAEADSTGDDVDVVVVGVLVANRDPSGVLWETHLMHEVAGDGVPLLTGQRVAFRQSQRRVPQVLLDVRSQRPHSGKLAGQLGGLGAGKRSADDLRALQARGLPALVHQVTHQAGSAAPSSYARFHSSPSSSSSGTWSSRTPSRSRRSACTWSRNAATSAGGMPCAWPCSIATW